MVEVVCPVPLASVDHLHRRYGTWRIGTVRKASEGQLAAVPALTREHKLGGAVDGDEQARLAPDGREVAAVEIEAGGGMVWLDAPLSDAFCT